MRPTPRFLLLALLMPTWAAAQAPVLEISGARFRPLPLAAPGPLGEGVSKELAASFDSAYLFDLTAAGIFQVLDRKGFIADAKEGMTAAGIKFERWSSVGAEGLVKVRLSSTGEQLRGDLRLYSVGTAREEFQISHSVQASDARRLAHFLVGAVYRHYTRETGPFETRIAYVRDFKGNKEIWMSDWDGHHAEPVFTKGINLLPTVTPDGRGAAFTSYRRGRPDLYVQAPGEPGKALVQNGHMATGADYSPDGKRIAYAQSEEEGTQIHIADADGRNARKVTDTPSFINTSPSWAPDGKRIAFVSNRAGNPQLYVMNADGSGVRRLTFQGNYNQTPVWSPRGDLIAFTARDERNAFDLFTVEVESGRIARLTQDAGNNEEPSFSPNGRHIVFTTTRKGGSHLYVMRPDGQNQVALPIPRGTYLQPAWGPAAAGR